MSRFPVTFRKRFWSRIKIPLGRNQSTACWLWQWGIANSGYGQLSCREVSPAPMLAHRVSYELTHGPIPKGQHVLHKCDVRRCCRPDHLFLGTQRDNNHDRASKGRTASGDKNGARTHRHLNPFVLNGGSGLARAKHPMAKLSEKAVAKLRRLFKSKCVTQSELARQFNISNTHVGRILRGRSWKTT